MSTKYDTGPAANVILKPDLCMKNGKIDPKVGKTDPHLENMEFVQNCVDLKNRLRAALAEVVYELSCQVCQNSIDNFYELKQWICRWLYMNSDDHHCLQKVAFG